MHYLQLVRFQLTHLAPQTYGSLYSGLIGLLWGWKTAFACSPGDDPRSDPMPYAAMIVAACLGAVFAGRIIDRRKRCGFWRAVFLGATAACLSWILIHVAHTAMGIVIFDHRVLWDVQLWCILAKIVPADLLFNTFLCISLCPKIIAFGAIAGFLLWTLRRRFGDNGEEEYKYRDGRAKDLIVVITCFCIAVGLSLSVPRIKLVELRDLAFDSAAWKADRPWPATSEKRRGDMLADVLRKFKLLGMTVTELKELLGPPDQTRVKAAGGEVYIYGLHVWWYDSDAFIVSIKDGRVVGYRVRLHE